MPSDPLILAFDTSAAHCAAALLSGETVLAERQDDMAKGQAEHLMSLLEDILKEGGAGWPDLRRIGVGIGPGNFTGIRIAVSAARGLSLALNVPALGVSTFRALYEGQNQTAVTAINARGGQAYLQVSRPPGDPKSSLPSSPIVVDANDVPLSQLPAAPVFITPAWQPDLTLKQKGSPKPFATSAARYPVAVGIARVAARSDPQRCPPKPLYVRQADAAPPKDPAPTILP